MSNWALKARLWAGLSVLAWKASRQESQWPLEQSSPAPVYTKTHPPGCIGGLNGSPPPRAARLREELFALELQQVRPHGQYPGWKETVFSLPSVICCLFLPHSRCGGGGPQLWGRSAQQNLVLPA